MTIVVTHTTPADSSFSTEGAAAWNANHALSGVGTMAEQDANNVAITGGSIENTVIGNTTPNAATFTTLTATGQTSLGGVEGSESLRVVAISGSTRWVEVSGSVSGNTSIRTRGAGNPSFQFVNRGTGPITFSTADSLSNEQLRVSHTASAVNYVQVTGAATTAAPVISAQGSDTNITLFYQTKGVGSHVFGTRGSVQQFRVLDGGASSTTNYATVAGSAANQEPVWAVAGSDTNISMAFQSKGTGGISLSTGSTGTNLVNGTSVTAITGTAAGNGYTSFPTVTISAPTTAGGVQATVSVTRLFQNLATIASGGTGYSVNDVLTVVGGTPAGVAATLTVTAVSGGVITAVSSTNFAQYTALPANPVSVTGGTGSGATLNLQWSVLTGPGSYTITNAGSGYVEQPTVTFSGGGGSGAAAYATVGSGSVFRALGATGSQSVSFFTPGGEALRLRDAGGSADSYPMISPSSALTTIVAQGNANANLFVGANGSGSLRLTTNGTSLTEQLRVSHTASAVNYVQVTGAATGGRPRVEVAGSDTNIDLSFTSKGTGLFVFNTGGGTQTVIQNTASTNSYLTLTGSASGIPSIGVAGSPTNIDLALTPKGTGLVRFGTYTASMALTVQGYIEIKDSGGTVRRLAVVA